MIIGILVQIQTNVSVSFTSPLGKVLALFLLAESY